MASTHDNQTQARSRAGGIWGEFLSLSVYKRNQGRLARQVTFGALAVLIGLGIWRLSQLLPLWFAGGDASTGVSADLVRYLVPWLLLAGGLWIAYRVVNVPRFADFLIAVEAEMAKVSWPTGDEVARSSAVIIFLIFALAAILAAYDLFWMFVLRKILRIT